MSISRKNGALSLLEYQVIAGLIQERKSRRVTQEELARRLHTKQSMISRLENMSSSPTLRFVSKIADGLGIELAVSFRTKTLTEPNSELNLDSASNEYICVNCLYRWESKLNRSVIQCPQCHKRQGIQFSEYSKALQALQDVRLQVKKSPPFKKPPPLKSIGSNTPKMLKLILKTAGSTFPSPRPPISLLFRMIEQSRQKQVDAPKFDIDDKNMTESV